MTNDKLKMREIVEQYYKGNFQVIIDNIIDNIKWTSHKMSNVQLKNKQEVINFLENVPKKEGSHLRIPILFLTTTMWWLKEFVDIKTKTQRKLKIFTAIFLLLKVTKFEIFQLIFYKHKADGKYQNIQTISTFI
ncbi:MAG TPA: hypothetical protein VI423_08005 [Paenisporosarcina sp.]|nr:hypothetical protein [Paenisporosarcina sp.]